MKWFFACILCLAPSLVQSCGNNLSRGLTKEQIQNLEEFIENNCMPDSCAHVSKTIMDYLDGSGAVRDLAVPASGTDSLDNLVTDISSSYGDRLQEYHYVRNLESEDAAIDAGNAFYDGQNFDYSRMQNNTFELKPGEQSVIFYKQTHGACN